MRYNLTVQCTCVLKFVTGMPDVGNDSVLIHVGPGLPFSLARVTEVLSSNVVQEPNKNAMSCGCIPVCTTRKF